jgi:hypothetical protein
LLDASGSATIGIRYKGSSSYGSILVDNSNTTGGGFFSSYQNGSQKAIFGVSGAIEGNTTSDCGLYAETGGGIRLYTNGSSTAKAVLTSGGSLGIGTTSPSTELHVSGSSARLRIQNTGTGNGQLELIGGTQTNPWYVYADNSRNLVFQDHSAERARIDSSGRLLVGTSSAQGQSIFQAVGNSSASTDPGDIRVIRGLNISSIGANVGAELGIIKFGALENSVCQQICSLLSIFLHHCAGSHS